MKDESGDNTFPIWLLGDSEPQNWADVLEDPFDSRHPAVHNIWTPIISKIQGRFYKSGKLRLNEDRIYKRNPIKQKSDKPVYKDNNWGNSFDEFVTVYEKIISEHKPVFVFTFGSFSFEFSRRVMKEKDKFRWDYWNTERLGVEFTKRIHQIDFNITNCIPLLHASIARGHFLKSHTRFTLSQSNNYFDYTSEKIASAMLKDMNFISKIIL